MRVPGSLASDVRSLDALKSGAGSDPKGAVRQAATQFEALFMQMVLKSMRDSVPKSGMFEGPGADVYQGMLDTQFAQAMTGRPGGLSELIAKQLMRAMKVDDADGADAAGAGATPRIAPKVSADGLMRSLLAQDGARSATGDDDEPSLFPTGAQRAMTATAQARALAALPRREAAEAGASPMAEPLGSGGTGARPGTAPAAFVDRMWGAAAAAERDTGVPAGFIVGQAALESGWGRQELRRADGTPAFNLFGIKAGASWKGESIEATTTEWVDGRPIKTVERFRAYASYQDAFTDWARLMTSNPRYAGVLQAGGSIESFASNLQRAGYATDPDYASKLTRTITQALTLRRAST